MFKNGNHRSHWTLSLTLLFNTASGVVGIQLMAGDVQVMSGSSRWITNASYMSHKCSGPIFYVEG